ncbi:hypothetical protein LPTSP2_01840 [Leptospira ellinghausenii]|uniref:Uncharacterized protein n=1 Tax=Leptospira ellinghausenii TaxID=1917822 RepID=A0A2P2D8H7_9LEPT|nr:hypothetical protein LPTSP2_01840 [Leptospira ellinghausenii]
MSPVMFGYLAAQSALQAVRLPPVQETMYVNKFLSKVLSCLFWQDVEKNTTNPSVISKKKRFISYRLISASISSIGS